MENQVEDIALGSPSPSPTDLGLVRPSGLAVLRLRAPASLGWVLGETLVLSGSPAYQAVL